MIYFDNNHTAYGDISSLNGKEIVFSCSDEMWADFIQNPLKYVWSENEIIPNPDFAQEKGKQERLKRIEEIKAELTVLDAQAVRPLRAILTDCATDEDREILKDIEIQANALREELSSFL